MRLFVGVIALGESDDSMRSELLDDRGDRIARYRWCGCVLRDSARGKGKDGENYQLRGSPIRIMSRYMRIVP
jgi:hypothetical protein